MSEIGLCEYFILISSIIFLLSDKFVASIANTNTRYTKFAIEITKMIPWADLLRCSVIKKTYILYSSKLGNQNCRYIFETSHYRNYIHIYTFHGQLSLIHWDFLNAGITSFCTLNIFVAALWKGNCDGFLHFWGTIFRISNFFYSLMTTRWRW